jgi:hypothetical protein
MPGATENVAAADHDADLHASFLHGDDFVGQPTNDLRIDAVVGIAHQRFTGELEQDAVILRLIAHGVSGLCGVNRFIVAAAEGENEESVVRK